MGTSTSYTGPTGNNPLLPAWAQPAPPPAEPEPPQLEEDEPQEPQDAEDQHEPQRNAEPMPQPVAVSWPAAKRSLTRFARDGGRQNLGRAARAYVRARGGAAGASRSAAASRRAAAALGGFLAAVARGGVDAALDALGLADMVGQSAEAVLVALVDALAPAGDLRDDATAREAMSEVLEELYERYDLADQPLAALDALNAEVAREVLQSFIAESIYHRWIADLGRCIERGAVSEHRAVELEREMRGWVRETVALELERVDLLQINWRGAEGQQLADRIHREAYELLQDAAE